MKEAEKLYYRETEKSLQSKDKNIVKARLKELRKTGNATLLPLMLNLLSDVSDKEIIEHVFELLGELRDQECTHPMVTFIDQNAGNEHLSRLIASCWQSRLDYSGYLKTFTHCFITGDYQTAIESFTVIEEALWKTDPEHILECLNELDNRSSEIQAEKKPLLAELLKVMKEGRSPNRDEYLNI